MQHKEEQIQENNQRCNNAETVMSKLFLILYNIPTPKNNYILNKYFTLDIFKIHEQRMWF